MLDPHPILEMLGIYALREGDPGRRQGGQPLDNAVVRVSVAADSICMKANLTTPVSATWQSYLVLLALEPRLRRSTPPPTQAAMIRTPMIIHIWPGRRNNGPATGVTSGPFGGGPSTEDVDVGEGVSACSVSAMFAAT